MDPGGKMHALADASAADVVAEVGKGRLTAVPVKNSEEPRMHSGHPTLGQASTGASKSNAGCQTTLVTQS